MMEIRLASGGTIRKTRIEISFFSSSSRVHASIRCLDASIRDAIRNAFARALTCIVDVSMMISDIRRRGMPDLLHVPVRIPAASEIVHSRLLRGRGRLLAGQPGHGSRHLLHVI